MTLDTPVAEAAAPTSSTAALAALAARTASTAFPDALIGLMEECVLDLAGHTAFSAQFAESSPAFREGTRMLDPAGQGFSVIGERGSYSQPQAALLNGAFSHTMDFDDTNVFGVLHPGSPVISAALATAEAGAASGRALLEAIAVGYEVACRIGGALGPTAYDRGFHITSVAGIFGAIAAAGRLRGLDAATIESAFGIAGSLAAGSMQYLDSGAWNKRLHPGFAAHGALMALGFAQAGVFAAREPIEGRFGLLNGYSAKPRPEALGQDLGDNWVALQTGIKPYPSCRMTHGAVDAALALRERCTHEERLAARLHIEIPAKAFDIVGEPLPAKIAPRNIVDGQFSVYFQVACAWLDGKLDWQSYERLGQPDVEALARRMTVQAGSDFQGPGARLQVEGRDDLRIEIKVPSGEPSTPLGRPRLRQKYLSLATPVYGAAQADALATRLLALRREPSAAALIRALRAGD
ncbi:MmgE/PrpD family protein [Variovorax sp. GB1P17]|uniref:MmgE/PrpD family protein n=1 Tax=Variovorax sp. GB1P17 TaxID=3443740 RepID=UPI003F45C275